MSIKIALCISGLANNSIDKYIHLFNNFIYDKNEDIIIDIFCHLFDDNINEKTKSRVISILKPKYYAFEKSKVYDILPKYHKKETDKKIYSNAINMFDGIEKVQVLRKSYEESNNFAYDIVLRIRYDLYHFNKFKEIIDFAIDNLDDNNIIFPETRHFVGICDQIFFAKSKVMNNIIGIYKWVWESIDKEIFVNENLLLKYVLSKNIKIKCINIEYTIIREHMIDFKESVFHRVYNDEYKLPRISKIDETRYIFLNKYISNKSESFSYIYCLLGPYYEPIRCKIKNVTSDEYLNIVNPNEKSNHPKINCNTTGSIFIIKSHKINICIE